MLNFSSGLMYWEYSNDVFEDLSFVDLFDFFVFFMLLMF